MDTLYGGIKIGPVCLAAPLLGEASRRRAGHGRHGEALRALAGALLRARPASAIVLGAGLGEALGDLAAAGLSCVLCVEAEADSYALLRRNAAALGGTAYHALVTDGPQAAHGAPALSFGELLARFPSFHAARLLMVSGSQDGPGALASALTFIREHHPLLALELRLSDARPAAAWTRLLETLVQLGYDRGLAFDPIGHPLGRVTPERCTELLGALVSGRAHGGGLASFTVFLGGPAHQGLIEPVQESMAARTGSVPLHRIAVVRLDNLGDHVLGAGLFAALRDSFPHSKRVAVIPAGLAELYARCPSVDAILTLPPRLTYLTSQTSWSQLMLHVLDCPRFDLVIQPRFAEDWYAAGPICAALAAPGARIIGFKQERSPLQGYDPNPHFTELLEAPDTLHTANYTSLVAQAATGRPLPTPPTVWWAPEDWERVARRFGLLAHGFIVVGVGASSPRKLPSLDIYRHTVRCLLASPYPVLLAGSAGEQGFAEALQAHFPGGRVISAAGALPLHELAALLAHARLYVGPDAGPKHMAAASRTPVLEISWVPGDYPITSRGDATAGRCWMAFDTLTRIVHPDRETYIHASQRADFNERPIPGIDPEHIELAIRELLAIPGAETAGASHVSDPITSAR
jgi:heptosyltransferase-3